MMPPDGPAAGRDGVCGVFTTDDLAGGVKAWFDRRWRGLAVVLPPGFLATELRF